jgi:hypothetical protein
VPGVARNYTAHLFSIQAKCYLGDVAATRVRTTMPQQPLCGVRAAGWPKVRLKFLYTHVRRELLRSVLLDVTPIIAATACHQRNYVERYSRYMWLSPKYPRDAAFYAQVTALITLRSIYSSL